MLQKLFILILLAIVSVSCASGSKSVPTQYYQLVGPEKYTKQYDNKITVYVVPVSIPEAINRQPLVSYKDDKTKLLLSNTHLWASDIRELISETLVVTLQGYLPKSEIHRLRKAINKDGVCLYIQIQEFSGELGKQTVFKSALDTL